MRCGRDDFECAPLIGLRHPASASCLGRHLRLAGRCPNNSSLFPPLAVVVVVALCTYSAERIFLIEQCRSVCGRSGIAFSREGVVKANGSCRACFLRKRRRGGKVFLFAELPQSKPDGFASSLEEGASGAPANFALEPETVPLCQRPHLRGGWHRVAMTGGVFPQTFFLRKAPAFRPNY